MFGGNQELANYVLKASGLSRKALNIMCFIGVFIFGWLLAIVFDGLGKKGKGWAYLVPIIIIFGISRSEGDAAALGIFAPIIYVVGWVHANRILSRYQSLARKRIAEIETDSEGRQKADYSLEKGLLQHKVLCDVEGAVATLRQVLVLPDGDPQLLNLAGAIMSDKNHLQEAKQFFERASSSASDDALVKQIQQNMSSLEKRLK